MVSHLLLSIIFLKVRQLYGEEYDTYDLEKLGISSSN